MTVNWLSITDLQVNYAQWYNTSEKIATDRKRGMIGK